MKVFLVFGALLLSGLGGYLIGYRGGVFDSELRQVSHKASEEKVAEVSNLFNSRGAGAVIEYCKKTSRLELELGTIWLSCSLTAEFYDPVKDEVVTRGKDIIFPVSLYTRVENGLHFLSQGYQMRHIEITVSAWREDPSVKATVFMQPISSIDKEI